MPRDEGLDDDFQEGSESAYDAWLTAFKAQRRLVEQAIHENPSKVDRKALLKSAQLALPEFHSPDLTALEDVAEHLEEKLGDLVCVLHGDLDRETLGIKVPVELDGIRVPDSLLSRTGQDERRWFFVGGALEILHHYRNGPGALVVAKRNLLLEQLAKSIDVFERRLRSLDRYLIVEQSFDIEERLWIESLLADHKRIGRELFDRYQQALTSTGPDGLSAILDKNFYEVRNQFLQAFLELAVRTYGHVTKPALDEVLRLKSVGIFNLDQHDQASEGESESNRGRVKRARQRAVRKILNRAAEEGWPLLPVLQLFNHNSGYGGRTSAKRASRPADNGIASAILHLV